MKREPRARSTLIDDKASASSVRNSFAWPVHRARNAVALAKLLTNEISGGARANAFHIEIYHACKCIITSIHESRSGGNRNEIASAKWW